MTINQLIKKLQKIQEQEGNLQVVVQARDLGCKYPDWDDKIYGTVEDWTHGKKYVIL